MESFKNEQYKLETLYKTCCPCKDTSNTLFLSTLNNESSDREEE